jgi:restriction system protein
MAVPDFQTIMLPLLECFGDGQEHSTQELLDNLAKRFSLTEEELNALLPSGKQKIFYNRVGWARTYLTKAGLLEMSRRSYYRITDRGRQVLARKPPRIDMKFLEQFPEYIEFRERESGRRKPSEITSEVSEKTPEEILEDAYESIRDGLAQELLGLVKQSSPSFFSVLSSNFLSRWDTVVLAGMRQEQLAK